MTPSDEHKTVALAEASATDRLLWVRHFDRLKALSQTLALTGSRLRSIVRHAQVPDPVEMTDCGKAHHAFHNPWKSLRDSHIPHRPTAIADGKVENQKQVPHFPTARLSLFKGQKTYSPFRLALAVPTKQTGKIVVPEWKNT
jgi:hypothetical protein